MQHSCPKVKMPNKYPLMQESNSTQVEGVDCVELICSPSGTVGHSEFIVKCDKGNSSKGLCVKGQLNAHLHFWEETVKAPEFVLNVIRHCYSLPFMSVPESRFFSNQKSAFEHCDFVTESVEELKAHGCIRQVEARPLICSPLLVVLGNLGKKRLVINLRYLNQFLWQQKNLSMKICGLPCHYLRRMTL